MILSLINYTLFALKVQLFHRSTVDKSIENDIEFSA